MMKSICMAVVLGLCMGTLFGNSAVAQSTNKSAPAATANQAMPPEQEPQQQEDSPPNLVPVLWITSVEAIRTTHEPVLDVIRVRGVTSTEGWEGGTLIPLTRGTPRDGMLDLAFVAQAPTNTTAPSKNPVIEAIFTIEPGHPFKGVRVHSATNRVTLKSIPGFAE